MNYTFLTADLIPSCMKKPVPMRWSPFLLWFIMYNHLPA